MKMSPCRLFILCLVFYVLSGVESHLKSICADSDREEVADLWNTMWSSSYAGRKSALASEAFKWMFATHPELEAHFPLMNVTELSSPTFRGHAVRIVHGFDIPINFLSSNYEVLVLQLKYLGKQHTRYTKITPEHFAIMRDSLEAVFVQSVPGFLPYAWRRCVQGMQDVIINTMIELSQ